MYNIHRQEHFVIHIYLVKPATWIIQKNVKTSCGKGVSVINSLDINGLQRVESGLPVVDGVVGYTRLRTLIDTGYSSIVVRSSLIDTT